MTELGARLKQIRVAGCLSRGQLAKRLGEREKTVARYEAGEETPTDDYVRRVTEVCGLSKMRWVFADGTEYSNRKVQGTSKLADAIRQDLAELKAGYGVPVQVEAQPSEPDYLDLDNPQLVHAWLWAFTYNWRFEVKLVSAPELAPIESYRGHADDDDGLDEEGRLRIY